MHTTEQPVSLRRLVSPWSSDPNGFFERFAPFVQQWSRAPASAVAQFIDCGLGAESVWVVQGLDDGESLRTMLSVLSRHAAVLERFEAVALMEALATSLLSIHELTTPLRHGDVCPSNVHVTVSGHVLLTDIGIATAAGVDSKQGAARCELEIVAPEQASGQGLHPMTDIYRLGVVFTELLFGTLTVTAEVLAQAPGTLSILIARMRSEDPNARPPAREVLQVVSQVARESGWDVGPSAIAQCFRRIFVDRTPLTDVPPGRLQELIVRDPYSSVGGPRPSSPSAVVGFDPDATPQAATPLGKPARARQPDVSGFDPDQTPPSGSAPAQSGADLPAAAPLTIQLSEGALSQPTISLDDRASLAAATLESMRTVQVRRPLLTQTMPPDDLPIVPVSSSASVIGRIAPVKVAVDENRGIVAARPSASRELSARDSAPREPAARDPASRDPASRDSAIRDAARSASAADTLDGITQGNVDPSKRFAATFDDAHALLLRHLVSPFGDLGMGLEAFVSLVGDVASVLELDAWTMDRLRFCAAAIGIANVGAGRAAWNTDGTRERVEHLLRPMWSKLEATLSPALREWLEPSASVESAVLFTVLWFASFAGEPTPSAARRAPVLVRLNKHGAPNSTIEALSRVLSRATTEHSTHRAS